MEMQIKRDFNWLSAQKLSFGSQGLPVKTTAP